MRLTAEDAASRPRLESAAEVMAPLAPRDPARIADAASASLDAAARRRFWGDRLPEEEPPQPLAGHVNATLGDLLVERPELLVFGEDVGPKGGVYGVTRGLHKRAGAARVFDTILDEQAILGLAIGAGQLGLLPVPEIQYLAYVHNALDQIRGEAASMQFFSQGRFRNPMVVRIAGYAYQKGFGGHFHNDDSVAALRDIPGLVIASPSRGDDAAAMLRTSRRGRAERGIGLPLPRADRALPHGRPPRARRRPLGLALPAEPGARAHRARARTRRGERSAPRLVRERPLDEPARREAPRGAGDPLPRARPALARCRCRWRIWRARPRAAGACSSWTRRGARAGCRRRC